MEQDHPAIIFCRHELDLFRHRLREMETGPMRFGTSNDGMTWTDTTPEDIAFAKAKIAELTAFLEGQNT